MRLHDFENIILPKVDVIANGNYTRIIITPITTLSQCKIRSTSGGVSF